MLCYNFLQHAHIICLFHLSFVILSALHKLKSNKLVILIAVIIDELVVLKPGLLIKLLLSSADIGRTKRLGLPTGQFT